MQVDEDEIDYLLAAVNRYFKQALRRGDIVQSFSGVRPLYDDGAGNPSAVTRDYVFGGKITTFRKLAEYALQKLEGYFPDMGRDWTSQVVLPGGDIIDADYMRFLADIQSEFPWLPRDLAAHWGRPYGTRMRMIIGEASSVDDLGQPFGPRLFETEVRYLHGQEWAKTTEDILYRRTKENWHMTKTEIKALTTWFDSNLGQPA